MENYSEPLVGCIAIALAATATAVSLGPWDRPYELRTVAAVRRRFGKAAARFLWLAVAATALVSGLAILTDARPSYAVPDGDPDKGAAKSAPEVASY